MCYIGSNQIKHIGIFMAARNRPNKLPELLPQQQQQVADMQGPPENLPVNMANQGVNPVQAMAQYAGVQQQQQPQVQRGVDPADILIPKERIGRRPYRKYYIISALVMYNCMTVTLAQFFPVIRAFVALSYITLIVLAVMDTIKQQNTRGYIDQRYFIQLGVTYGAMALAVLLFHLFILYV